MNSNAQNRWDRRYQAEERYRSFTAPRDLLIDHADLLPAQGLALDVAMGLGGNASFLLKRGLRVVGVDLSGVAVRSARTRLPELMAVQADLGTFYIPAARFDVLLNFYYLDRSLWPAFTRALQPGGLLFFETMTAAMQSLRPDIAPVYLLQPGELAQAFPALETLYYDEGWSKGRSGHPRATARLIARKDTSEQEI